MLWLLIRSVIPSFRLLFAHHPVISRHEFPNQPAQFIVQGWGQQFLGALAKQPGIGNFHFPFWRWVVFSHEEWFDPPQAFHHTVYRLVGPVAQVLVSWQVSRLDFVQNVQNEG